MVGQIALPGLYALSGIRRSQVKGRIHLYLSLSFSFMRDARLKGCPEAFSNLVRV